MWNWGSNIGLGWVVFSIKKWLQLIHELSKAQPKGKPKLYGLHKQSEVQVLISKGLQSIWKAIHGKACQGKPHIKGKVPKYNEADQWSLGRSTLVMLPRNGEGLSGKIITDLLDNSFDKE